MPGRLPYSTTARGVRLSIRLVPRSSRNEVVGLVDEADGALVLKVAVTAPPVEGQANEALCRLLARLFRLPPRDLTVVLGAGDRRKVVEIAGDPARLAPLIARGLEPWSRPGS